MTRTKRLCAVVIIAILLAAGTAMTASGLGDFLPRDWALSCVELNDLIERYHLDRQENVGIYQRVHGGNADIACQSDHRDDVRALFHWAFRPIEELNPVDPRYIAVSPSALQDQRAFLVHRLDQAKNGIGGFTLSKGRYIAVINWWDKEEYGPHQQFRPHLYSYQLGLVAWSVLVTNSDADTGSAHIQFEVHAREPFIWIDAGEQSHTKWEIKFYRPRYR